ncbi:MAG: Por Secre tail protein [Bacteroidota bacterium]|nr:Por Secre tail protein [Bacteroidota bacterium]
MKKLNNILTSVIAIALAFLPLTAIFSTNAAAKEQAAMTYYHLDKAPAFRSFTPNYVISNDFVSEQNKRHDKLMGQVIEFTAFDSLANAYSFFSDRQNPYIYHYPSNTLVVIKRGYVDIDASPSYPGTDTKNNLFIRTSTDLGSTWSTPILLYNAKTDAPRQGARYPSVFPFMYDNELTFVFTSPVTDNNGWQGFVDGIYYQQTPALGFSNNATLSVNDLSYGWGTDAKIIGGETSGNEPFGLAVGGLMPPGGNRDMDADNFYEDNSNLANRYTTQFGDWPTTIPIEWASNNFWPIENTGTSDSTRNSVIVGLKYGPNEDIYFAAFGNFQKGEVNGRPVPAVSISNDQGVTWSEFDIFGFNTAKAYITQQGFNPDSAYFSYGSKGFSVLDNGDFSFVSTLYDARDTANVPYDQQMHQIVEVYKEGGVWGIRKVADISGYTVRYLDKNNVASNNQMDIELQLARSVDGKTLVAKWVDFVDTVINDVPMDRYTLDIFLSARNVGTGGAWKDKMNATQSIIYDRTTWLPDYVPNKVSDMITGLPILKTFSIPKPGDESDFTQAQTTQRQLEEPQYVMIGGVDIPVGVEENSPAQNNSVDGFYPNPAGLETEFVFNIGQSGNAVIELYNTMGQKMMTLHNGFLSEGIHSINLNTANLPVGAYYCTVASNGEKLTKALSVIR